MTERKKIWMVVVLLSTLTLLLSACGEKKKPESAKAPEEAPFTFGVILVGPYKPITLPARMSNPKFPIPR
jgi:hypothetical protein